MPVTHTSARDMTTRGLDEAQRNGGYPQRAIAHRHRPGIRCAAPGLSDD
jgi:hypothetical protein